MDFDEMQAVWRVQDEPPDSQPAAGTKPAVPSDYRTLVGDLRTFERYERRVIEIKLALVATLTVGGAAWLIARTPRSPLFAAGAAWCLVTIAAAAVLMWRARFTAWRAGIEQPTIVFLDRAAAALHREERAARFYLLILMLCLVVGLQVMLSGLVSTNLVARVVALLPLAAFGVGIRVRDLHIGRRNRALLRHIADVRGRLEKAAEP
jgi:hypothetical protein